jgi:hypothetical protein
MRYTDRQLDPQREIFKAHPISRESTRPISSARSGPHRCGSLQNGDITKDRFQRLIKDIRHLVLEILSCNERVEEILPEQTLECDDFSTCPTDRRVDIESFPEMVDRVWARLGSDVKEDAYANSQFA